MAPPKTRNGKSAPVLPDTFWEKARKWADKWRSLLTVTGAVVGAFLAAGSFFLEDYHKISKIQTDSQTISEISNKINATNEVVSAIRGRVDNIDGQLEILRPLVEFEIQSRLKKSSALPLRDFQRDLPNLHPVLKQARILGVRSQPPVLSSISTKLVAASASVPGYWPIAAEFISYRSESLSSRFVSAISVENLPVCTTTTLHPSVVISVPSPTKFTARLPFFEHCKVMLDDPAQAEEINREMRFGGAGAGIAFHNSLVQYRGGEISIRVFQDAHDPNRKISSLAFVDCTFDLTAPQTPSPNAEEILKTLLLNHSGDILIPPGTTARPIPPPSR